MRFQTIREISVLPPLTNPSIDATILTPQTLIMPAAKEIFVDATLGNAWNNRTPRQISRTGVDVSIQIFTPIHSGMIKYYTTGSSDSSGTRIPIGNSNTNTAPPCGLNVSPNIGDIQKSTTPDLRDSDKIDTSVDGKFTNNLVALPIFTDILSDEISNTSIRGLYARIGMHLSADPVNSVAPKFVYLGFSTVDVLDKGAGLWTPATRVGRPMDVAHWSAPDHIFGETTAVGDAVSTKSDYNYKTDF